MDSIESATKSEIIEKFRINEKDCGSSEVQIALLTQRISQLTKHFAKHSKDDHSRRGMLALINRRKKLLQYLRTENLDRYKNTITALGLRK
ncbi:MAG: 30S ribosomal protein S15 [Deltaproteobacteria bacterium]|nr:30S ribosomal protein S15 [Deltaproteobacteria bacterium]